MLKVLFKVCILLFLIGVDNSLIIIILGQGQEERDTKGGSIIHYNIIEGKSSFIK